MQATIFELFEHVYPKKYLRTCHILVGRAELVRQRREIDEVAGVFTLHLVDLFHLNFELKLLLYELSLLDIRNRRLYPLIIHQGIGQRLHTGLLVGILLAGGWG